MYDLYTKENNFLSMTFGHIVFGAVTGYTVTSFFIQWPLVTMTAFVPKDVAIKLNLLLYRIIYGQIDN